MNYRRERSFLRSLCKGHIQDLVDEVGWSPIQCSIVKKRYLELKSLPTICLEIGISESQCVRETNKLIQKFHFYLMRENASEIAKQFEKFNA